MVIDQERAEEIKQVFKQVYDTREDAKALTGSANDLLKTLATKLDEEDPSTMLKGLKKAYVEYTSKVKGEADSLDPALVILSAIGED